MDKVNVYKHGELIIVERPLNSVNVTGNKLSSNDDVKLADSETTGNDHMLQIVPGVHAWSDESAEKFLVRCEESTKIYCKLNNRHTDLELLKGFDYEISHAVEYDHLERIYRKVVD